MCCLAILTVLLPCAGAAAACQLVAVRRCDWHISGLAYAPKDQGLKVFGRLLHLRRCPTTALTLLLQEFVLSTSPTCVLAVYITHLCPCCLHHPPVSLLTASHSNVLVDCITLLFNFFLHLPHVSLLSASPSCVFVVCINLQYPCCLHNPHIRGCMD